MLRDEDRARLPPNIDPDVLSELLDRVPEDAHDLILSVLIDPRGALGIGGLPFSSQLGADDPELAALIARLYR
jgi:hypothetical protein